MTSELISELDQDHIQEGADFNDSDYDYDEDGENFGPNKYSVLGSHGRIVQAEMYATENIVRSAGWLNDSPNGVTEVNKTPIKVPVNQGGSQWKTAVQDTRQEVIAERSKNISKSNSKQLSTYNHDDPNENNVKIVDQSYLTRDFKAKSKQRHQLIKKTIKFFNLNVEQQRAFCIIANHASCPGADQLRMYIAGIAGTGKSQVIKAVTQYFTDVNELHRFVILGPTGTSAALQNGSTYHSFLGITPNSSIRNEASAIAQLKARLEGVEYIFIDEVSMLSCHDLYKISARLAKAMNVYDLPFGGINVIFAGDFAQLPPVGGAALYSGTVGTQITSGLTPHSQESAVGKALWHQITTVVILRQNMRQVTQTEEDAKLRAALINMRYGKCTPSDIQFLRTKIAGTRPDQPNVAAKEFRNVAIICGVNSQKDIINQLGCERFAIDTDQKLVNFYSVDKWGKDKDPVLRQKGKKSKASSKHESSEIDFDDQLEIWKVHHGATENFAGKLTLCLGMPVMIRNNDATELCITKGQEGLVVGWQSMKGPHGKQILDTLFVQLVNPPKLVQIPGLPDNVVPIVKGTKTIQCIFPSDLKESIERQQVWVLPNFAMTGHAAQGKTRPYNVVHLNSCFSHMAYYSALSRSASAEGTIIIQGFDSKVITKGCSGYLRQEFREHEILDDITRLRFEGQLPDHIEGTWRSTLIKLYQQWKGTMYVPPNTDKLLQWSTQDPFRPLPIEGTPWQLVDKTKGKQKPKTTSQLFAVSNGTVPISSDKKHKLEVTSEGSSTKRPRITKDYSTPSPLGLKWDGTNWSCAYDSLFVILYHIWSQDPQIWTQTLSNINDSYLRPLSNGFSQVRSGQLSFEQLRDFIRDKLYAADPDMFPKGPVGTSVASLASTLFKLNRIVASAQQQCPQCPYAEDLIEDRLEYVLHASKSINISTEHWIDNLSYRSHDRCPNCNTKMSYKIFYDDPPDILILEYPLKNIKTSHKLELVTEDDVLKTLHLRGIVYHGGYHFTSQIVEPTGKIWYHDGRTTGNVCEESGQLNQMTDNLLKKCKDRNLVLAIYSQ